jgi:hypothetical protein
VIGWNHGWVALLAVTQYHLSITSHGMSHAYKKSAPMTFHNQDLDMIGELRLMLKPCSLFGNLVKTRLSGLQTDTKLI